MGTPQARGEQRAHFVRGACRPGGSAPPYLQQKWGAYGAAYGSQVFEIGVLAQAEEHDVPVPSPGIGDDLATAFPEALGDAADRYYNAIQRGTVTRKELDELAPALPSAIGRTSAERRLYETLLLARGKLQRPEDFARRDTLLLLLHAASHFGEAPAVDGVRWLLYAASSEDGQRFSLPNDRLLSSAYAGGSIRQTIFFILVTRRS